jgi:redox-sensitive bicupin YhaK (pirin superfamily)
MYHGSGGVPGFPRHPHRGFETVSVVRHGRIDHTDSLGCAGRFGGGDVQWMTAGAGIVHSEMFPLLDQRSENRMEMFQIWLNLPKRNKMADPHFKMLWSEQIPRAVFRDAEGRAVQVTVIAGPAPPGTTGAPPAPPPASWAADPSNGVAIWTLRLDPGAVWTLPPASVRGTRRNLYVFKGDFGRVSIGDRTLPPGRRTGAELDPSASVRLVNGSPTEPAEMMMLQGAPIGEPVVQHGPFVACDRRGIEDAFRAYQRTRFGDWPWKSDGPVHARTDDRFALYADGRREEPGTC